MILTFTSRDYDTALADLKTQATIQFPKWTKFSLANIGTILLQLMAMVVANASYYLNRVANELYLKTVKTRRNAARVLELMGYEMSGRVAASVDLEFGFVGGGVHGSDVTIPEGTPVETDDGVFRFETSADVTITAGNATGTVTAYEWTSREEAFETDGTTNQEVYLREEEYLDGTMDVTIASVGWTEVDDLLDSGAADKHYVVEMDDELRAILVFGDGTNGAVPSGSGTADYKTGGGPEANDVGISTITEIQTVIYDVGATPVDMTCDNAAQPSGGDDEETVNEARRAAPAQVRAQNRTVAQDDYQTNAMAVSGVSRVLALGANEDVAVPEGWGYVFVVPTGGGVAAAGLLASVKAYLLTTKPISMVTQVDAITATYTTVTITGAATAKTGFSAVDVKTAIDLALTTYFDYDNIDDDGDYTVEWGNNKGYVYLSEIIDVIMSTQIGGFDCVENVTLTGPVANVAIAEKTMPVLATLAGLTVS